MSVAIRFMYVIKHWSLDDWPVEPLGRPLYSQINALSDMPTLCSFAFFSNNSKISHFVHATFHLSNISSD